MFNKFLRMAIVAISCGGIQFVSTTLTTAAEDIPGMGKRFYSCVRGEPTRDQRIDSAVELQMDEKHTAGGSPSQLNLTEDEKAAVIKNAAYLVKGFKIREGKYANRNSGEIIWKAYRCIKGPIVAGDTWMGAKDSEPGIWMIKGTIGKDIIVNAEETELSEHLAEMNVRDEWEKMNCIANTEAATAVTTQKK